MATSYPHMIISWSFPNAHLAGLSRHLPCHFHACCNGTDPSFGLPIQPEDFPSCLLCHEGQLLRRESTSKLHWPCVNLSSPLDPSHCFETAWSLTKKSHGPGEMPAHSWCTWPPVFPSFPTCSDCVTWKLADHTKTGCAKWQVPVGTEYVGLLLYSQQGTSTLGVRRGKVFPSRMW